MNNYPTVDEILKADREQLGRWCRFLPSPTNEDEVKIINVIHSLFLHEGGWTPELSKKIGWEL
jgi:hypothetical protein